MAVNRRTVDGARSRLGKRGAIAAAVLVGTIGSGALVYQGTQAAFTGTTTNPGNSWTTGTVTLSDDDGGSTSMFTATGLYPGSAAVVKCIKVTYTGNVSAPVKLYSSGAITDTSAVAQYLNLKIEQGTGGTFASCTGFSGSTIYDSGTPVSATGTIADFGADTTYASGFGSFSPTTNGDSAVYRFTVSMQSGAPNTAQNAVVNAGFTWEARTP